VHLYDFADDKDALLEATSYDWRTFAESVRIGDRVTGRVIAQKDYGVFLDFGMPFPALVEVVQLHKSRMPIDTATLPDIGSTLVGQVIQIVPHRRCVRAIEVRENTSPEQ
jgi:ribosomal protein S1